MRLDARTIGGTDDVARPRLAASFKIGDTRQEMQAKLIEGGPLTYLLIEPDRYRPGAAYPLIVLLHGFGANMYDLAGLAPAIDASGYLYACPNAPYAVDLGGAIGYSWSRSRPGMPDLAEVSRDQPSAEDLLAGLLEDLTGRAGSQIGDIVVAGFSQGGGLALRFGLVRPQMFAGLAVLSGAFREPDGLLARLPEERGLPIFMAHGAFDPMVSLKRGQETKAFLESAGYRPEYHEYEMAHEISEEVIFDLVPWVHSVLPPLT